MSTSSVYCFAATILLGVTLSEGFIAYYNDYNRQNKLFYNYNYYRRNERFFTNYYRDYGNPYQCDGECSPNARCKYEGFKGWICKCSEGYSGDGYTCSETNPCKTTVCVENAYCRKNGNQGICLCPSGYFQEDGSCLKPEVCRNNPCDENAVCTARGRSYKCTCNDGYVGDGFRCRKGSRLFKSRFGIYRGFKIPLDNQKRLYRIW